MDQSDTPTGAIIEAEARDQQNSEEIGVFEAGKSFKD